MSRSDHGTSGGGFPPPLLSERTGSAIPGAGVRSRSGTADGGVAISTTDDLRRSISDVADSSSTHEDDALLLFRFLLDKRFLGLRFLTVCHTPMIHS